MKIQAKTNFPELAKAITEMGRQAEFSAAVALTRTGQALRGELQEQMPKVFDRPTPYAINGFFLRGATRTRLEAVVWVKDNIAGKGTPADRFLSPGIYGGSRTLKGMEKALQAAGLMLPGWFAVPAAGAQLDGFGNVRRAQIVQILSQLKVQRRAGYESRASNSAASKRAVARQGVTYFAIPQRLGRLAPGIYLKRAFAHGSAIRPVFLFVTSVNYEKRLPFFEIGDRVAARFPELFEQELKKAMAGATGASQLSKG